MDEGYKPLSCELIDYLEIWATQKRKGDIVFLTPEGTKDAVYSGITTWFARDGVEFLVLDSGVEVRLDRLVSVFGIPFGGNGLNSATC